jgi:hypothetical protein
MGILLSGAGWLLGNPTVILAIIGVWLASSWWGDVKNWWETEAATRPLVAAIEARDKVADLKDKMINDALLARDNAHVEIAELRAHLDDAEAARKVAGVPDCTWSRDDIRLLNSGRRRR